ncbi:MAG: hypothetical protein KBT46_05560 [Ruminococcus sp.]|nr:hypothetical protein [Candidatus Copronaster equi]
MRDSKKAIIVSIVFVLIISIISGIIIAPVFGLNTDRFLRKKLSGKINYAIIGASQGYYGFVPQIIDEKLDVCSYNLCGGNLTWNGRKVLFDEIITDNKLDTLVMEISYNAFVREDYDSEGNYHLLPRLGFQLGYSLNNIRITDLDQYYSRYFYSGIIKWTRIAGLLYKNHFSYHKVKDALISDIDTPLNNELKGLKKKHFVDITIKPENVSDSLSSKTLDTDFSENNIAVLDNIINECNERNINVIFAVVPISDSMIWMYNNMDEYFDKVKSITDSYGYPLFDFNLLKNRYALFNDSISYSSQSHFGKEGAVVFTEEYCKIMNKVKDCEDVSDYFYSSYEEMKRDSPYWRFME